MGQARNRPLLVTESLNVDTGERPIEFCESRFCADRVQFVIET